MYEYINRSIHRDDMSKYQYVSIYQYMKTNCRHVGDDTNTFSNADGPARPSPRTAGNSCTVCFVQLRQKKRNSRELRECSNLHRLEPQQQKQQQPLTNATDKPRETWRRCS